jgi:hypothetical protein
MSNTHLRSAGVTTAATLVILGSVTAFLFWGNFLLGILNAPPDAQGKYLYQTHAIALLLIAAVPPALIALGIWTGIGLFQLRPWARLAILTWASIALVFCLLLIAFRPFETFFFPDHFVSDLESLKQFLAIAMILLLLPVSVWSLFFFRAKSVKLQFLPANSSSPLQGQSVADKS